MFTSEQKQIETQAGRESDLGDYCCFRTVGS